MAKDLINVVTPVGELHWVNISGQGKQNYNKDGYEYVATLYLKGAEADELKKKIDAVIAKPPAGCELKSKGYKELLEDKEGNLHYPNKNDKVVIKNAAGEKEDITKQCKASGTWAFVFRTGVAFQDGKRKIVNVFNCAKPPQKVNMGEKKIGNGTKGAISGRMRMYERGSEYGVSLFLHAVQIVSLKDFDGGAGFGEQEGDFYGVDDGAGFEAPQDGEQTSAPKFTPRL